MFFFLFNKTVHVTKETSETVKLFSVFITDKLTEDEEFLGKVHLLTKIEKENKNL